MITDIRQASLPAFKALALLAMAFGGVTVFASGSILFGADAVRDMAGNIVPFVVWFNFFAGTLYIATGVAIWRKHRVAVALSVAIAASTALIAAAFGIWVMRGGAYEVRTVGALALRTGAWVAIALALARMRRPT